MESINVLSLFDGISCGQLALQRAGIPVNQYFASEIDKHAIKVTQYNFPNTIQLGDVLNLNLKGLPYIDILFGGSPCQNLSSIGNKSQLNGLKSRLFYKFVEIKNSINPKFFLFENVASMSKESKQIISNLLGVEPVLINSNLFVPQNRRRLYWTNIPINNLPKDLCKTTMRDVLENGAESRYFLTEHQKTQSFKKSSFNSKPATDLSIARPLVTTAFSQRAGKDNLYTFPNEVHDGKTTLRKLTPKEFEILQGVPENYTANLSDNQRYKSIGNGWTVDVISCILKNINL